MKNFVKSFDELSMAKLSDGLVPVIIQDDRTLEVLMLGYMNREAFDKSIEEGRVTFFSRTKQRLWTKGESSGNFLSIVEIRDDCDHDALLVRVVPVGVVCHTGARSCFRQDGDSSEGFIRLLSDFIKTRHKEMPEGSYTTHLFNRGVNKIAQKVGEEAVETVIEAVDGNNKDMIYEASDLVYHLLVLLEATGHSIADIEEELIKRHS
ncbi:MAG: bifunctional phosphoribosyl-AMP cyclohydrolase/phosphoribosyl-ATP diphosphatase HisIE [Rikenellaceae bacterium]